MSDIPDPAVSILVPVFNGRRFLAGAVGSALDQDYDPLEIVIVDDGSSDGSSELADDLAESDRRIRVVHQANAGHAGAMNAAVAAARGRLVAVLDCDDEAVPGRIARQVRALADDPSLAAVGGAVAFMNASGVVFHTERFPTDPDVVGAQLRSSPHCPVLHSAMMMRKEVVLALGGYRPALSLALDYDLWLRMNERHRLSNVPEVVVRYRIHDEQTTGTKAEAVAIENTAARASARARAAGLPDPVPAARIPAAELRSRLGLQGDEIAASTVSYTTWYAKTSARAGNIEAAESLFAVAERVAFAAGDAQLIQEVIAARRAVGRGSAAYRWRAAVTRPYRHLVGRMRG